MQAIIMAAGRGSRLGELTDEKPKAFLEIKGIRLIEYNIALLHSIGVRDIIIVTGYKSEYFEELFEDVEGVKCVYNPFYEFMNVLGSFYIGQEYLKNEDTIYMHADTLCDLEIISLMNKSDADLVLPVDYKMCDEEAMKVRTDSGRVVEISKQISCDIAEGEFIGICKIRGDMVDEVKKFSKELMKNKKFKAYFEEVIQELIDRKKYKIIAISTEGHFWGEVDFLEDYNRVRELLPNSLFEIAN